PAEPGAPRARTPIGLGKGGHKRLVVRADSARMGGAQHTAVGQYPSDRASRGFGKAALAVAVDGDEPWSPRDAAVPPIDRRRIVAQNVRYTDRGQQRVGLHFTDE